MKRPSVIGLWLVALLPAGAGAQAPAGLPLEVRVQRLERMLENQNLSDILLQLQRLQQEVRQLRGELEVQAHTLEVLQRGQRGLSPDLAVPSVPQEGEPAIEPRWEVPPEEAEPSEITEAVVAPPRTTAEPAQGEWAQEEAEYQEAFALLAERKYDESVAAFRGFLARYPDSRYADFAQYWLGEAHYVIREFEPARQEFTKVLEAYPQSPKVPSAMLKLGYIDYELRQWRQARDQLAQLAEQYPDSTEASLAKRRLEQMRKEGR